jgi:putative transcriptional regulator
MKKTNKRIWARFDAITEQKRHPAALRDPGAQPITPENMRRMRRTPQV